MRADTTPLASGVGGLRSGLIRLVGCRVLPSALTLAFLGTDASPAPPQLQPFSDPIFAEVSARVGLAFKHVGGNLPLNHAAETMGSGGGFLDFDNDGWIDVYLVNGGLRPGTQPGRRASNRLFRNNGDGSFIDVTKKAGVGDFILRHGLRLCRLQQRRLSRYLRDQSGPQSPVPEQRGRHFYQRHAGSRSGRSQVEHECSLRRLRPGWPSGSLCL